MTFLEILVVSWFIDVIIYKGKSAKELLNTLKRYVLLKSGI